MREKEENRRTQESFVGNLKKKKSVLFNEREQERRVMFGGIELSSMDMLTLNEYFKEDRAILLFFGGFYTLPSRSTSAAKLRASRRLRAGWTCSGLRLRSVSAVLPYRSSSWRRRIFSSR